MPTKNPDIWAMIWAWCSLHANSIYSFSATFFIAILRIIYAGKERRCWRVLSESLLCGTLAVTSETIFEYFELPPKLAVGLGAVIALFGIDKVREIALRYVDKQGGNHV